MPRIVVLVFMALLLAACGGDDGDDDPAATPGDEVEGFTEGDFDELPRLPDSEEVGPPTRQDGAIAASYVVLGGTTPAAVVDDLQVELEAGGWRLIEAPRSVGDAVRADFVQERDRLELSAFPAQGFDEDYQNAVQYSYVLLSGLDDPRTNPSLP